jgi:hypothetical protein
MADSGEEENANLVETAIRLVRSEQVIAVKDRVFEVATRGFRAVFSHTISADEGPKTIYNQDILEHPEQEIKIVEKGESVEPFQEIEVDGETVIELNLDAFSEEGKREILDEIIPTEADQGRFLKHEQEQEFEVAEQARKDEKTNEILDYFSSYLSSHQLKLLRRSQSIRIAWEREDRYTPRRTMRKWKNDLKQQFGDSANIVSNFCSSGYYDEGGVLRHIMEDLSSEYENPEQIQEEYEEIVLEHPFVVYVGRYDTPERVKEQARTRISEYDSHAYTIPYIDIRAQGRDNRQTAEQALERLEGEFATLPVETIEDDRELVYRIDPENAEPL